MNDRRNLVSPAIVAHLCSYFMPAYYSLKWSTWESMSFARLIGNAGESHLLLMSVAILLLGSLAAIGASIYAIRSVTTDRSSVVRCLLIFGPPVVCLVFAYILFVVLESSPTFGIGFYTWFISTLILAFATASCLKPTDVPAENA